LWLRGIPLCLHPSERVGKHHHYRASFRSLFGTAILTLLPSLISVPDLMVVVVMLPDPFRGMGAWRNSTETQQSGHAPGSGPEVKNGSSAPTIRCFNVVVRSPPLFSRGWPKWRDNYHEGPDHPVAPNRPNLIVLELLLAPITRKG